MQRDNLTTLLVDERAGPPAEVALGAHIGTPAEAQQGLMDIGDLEVDLARFRCGLRPHDAPSFAQVRDLVPVGCYGW